MASNKPVVIPTFHRPLKPAERRLLRLKMRSLEAELKRKPPYVIMAIPFVVLWAITLLLSDAPWYIVTVFWIVVGAAICLWVLRDLRREPNYRADMLRAYRSAWDRNEAEVIDVKAKSFVQFEEADDEGPCYVFEFESDRLFFLHGQQYYPMSKFPSLDFSLVYPLEAGGKTADELIEKRGPREGPARTIPLATALTLEIPESLSVIRGRPDQIEQLLRLAT